MDQMDVSEVVRENKTNMTSEEQVKAIIRATRELEEKKTVIYEQLMGELEPKGIRLINFNKLSAEEGKILEEYFDREIAPYLSANIVSKQQPFPFLKNKDIYAVALLESKGGKTRTATIQSGGPKRQRDSLQNSNFKRMPGMEQRQNNPEFGYQGCTFRSYG
jgi:polyphosphate kinase